MLKVHVLPCYSLQNTSTPAVDLCPNPAPSYTLFQMSTVSHEYASSKIFIVNDKAYLGIKPKLAKIYQCVFTSHLARILSMICWERAVSVIIEICKSS